MPAAHRLSPLTTVAEPPGVDETAIRLRLLHEYGIEIAGCLGAFKGKAWRMAFMANSCRPENVLLPQSALAHQVNEPS